MGKTVAVPKIDGVGAETPTFVNATGGRQSSLPYRCDLLQPHALLHIAKIMQYGAARYGENNWHRITVAEHLNHAITHVLAHLAGDTQDDHIGHATWRMLSALDQLKSGREEKLQADIENHNRKEEACRTKADSATGFKPGSHIGSSGRSIRDPKKSTSGT
jgi:hypothetical protein